MKIFSARQPVVNRQQQLVAYELLFRNSNDNCFPDVDPKLATLEIIHHAKYHFGLQRFTNGLPALVNFCEENLLNDDAFSLPKDNLFIEIIESTKPTEEVYQACKKLFHSGYKLVLDDFVYEPDWCRFLPYIKVIKIDISLTPIEEVPSELWVLCRKYNIKLLAERIETQAQFELALNTGFNYFQGFWFGMPELTCYRVPAAKEKVIKFIRDLILGNHNQELSELFKANPKLTEAINQHYYAQINTQFHQYLEQHKYLRGQCLYGLYTLSFLPPFPAEKQLHKTLTRMVFHAQISLLYKPTLITEAMLLAILPTVASALAIEITELTEQLPISDDLKQALIDGTGISLYKFSQLSRCFENGSCIQCTKELQLFDISYQQAHHCFSLARKLADGYLQACLAHPHQIIYDQSFEAIKN
ncbi:EAL and HDOD domain-containing protein [Paraferrimonas sp. SM1919]|uniref:EAL and HDOD domain-containing protein n=1 Tax=Paraferrimonas sp. SM1919 TaxID=2662263 RepID=UPI0013D6311F|nr:EAL domain-containing protein [Paraferrimonas sp. SM1919]